MPLFNRVAATLQAGRVGSVVGGAFLLQLCLLLGLPVLLRLSMISFATAPPHTPEQATGGRPDGGAFTCITGNRPAYRTKRGSPGGASQQSPFLRLLLRGR